MQRRLPFALRIPFGADVGLGGDEKTALLTAVANEVARQGHFCARYRAKVPNLGNDNYSSSNMNILFRKREPESRTKRAPYKGEELMLSFNVNVLRCTDRVPSVGVYKGDGALVPSYKGYSSSEGVFPWWAQHGHSRFVFFISSLLFPRSLPLAHFSVSWSIEFGQGCHQNLIRLTYLFLLCLITIVAGTVAAQLAGGAAESESVPAKKTPAAKGKKAAAPAKKAASSTTTSNDSDFPTDFVPGLVFFSYPLHTADNTKALRDQILLDIPSTTATLFVSGLKDNMCQPSIFAKVFKEMKSTPREVVQVTDADHGLGFGSSKPGQAKKEALAGAISEWTVAFMDEAIAQKDGEEGGSGKKKVATGEVIKRKADLKKEADEWTVAISNIA